jgi:CRP-like cAMP-binding protein
MREIRRMDPRVRRDEQMLGGSAAGQAAGRVETAPGEERRRSPGETANLFLQDLPPATLEQVMPRLQRVNVSFHQTVIAADDEIPTVYFPESALFSEVIRLRDGATAEINLVGLEGVAGLSGYLDERPSALDVITLLPGTCLEMPVEVLRQLADQDPAIARRLDRYAQAVLSVRAIAGGCDRLHPVQTRLIRWLLKTRDRLDVDEFVFTQADLAYMLGVTRPTVSTNAILLQDAGLITYRRGRIHILDRAGLERLACECYWNVRDQFERLHQFPSNRGRTPPSGEDA